MLSFKSMQQDSVFFFVFHCCVIIMQKNTRSLKCNSLVYFSLIAKTSCLFGIGKLGRYSLIKNIFNKHGSPFSYKNNIHSGTV